MKYNKIWFVNKTYGYGWTPATGEGWLVLLIWLSIFIPFTILLESNWAVGLIGIFISTTALIFVCYKKGEKPKWQWGSKKEPNKSN